MSEPSGNDSTSGSNFALAQVATAFSHNFAEVMSKLPLLAAAAESVHQGFLAVLFDLDLDGAVDGSLGAVHTMTYASHSSWIDGMFNGAAGHVDTGRGATRRAIEFCLYASKVAGNEKRAEDWMKFHEDPIAKTRFGNRTKIPVRFDDDKYLAVQPLIVIHDMYSDAGAHANPATLVGKWKLEGQSIKLDYQADENTLVSDVIVHADVGNRMLQVCADLLAPYVRDQGALADLRRYARERTGELLMFVPSLFPKGAPSHVMQAIVDGNESALRQRFRELVEESKTRSKADEHPQRRVLPVRKGCARVVRR